MIDSFSHLTSDLQAGPGTRLLPSRFSTYLPLMLAVALMPLMITSQSFWLDEGDTGIYAIQTDFSAWLHHLTGDRNADCQMPLTMFTSWVVGTLVGTSEWALRAQNLLFGGIALVAMAAIARRTSLRWLPLLLALQPFFWFYMDQARPYAAQIAGGSLLAWVLSLVCGDDRIRGKWLLAFSLTALVAFSTSMLTAAAIGAVFMGCVIWGGIPQWGTVRRQIPAMAGLWLLSASLAAYFVWTVIRGAEGTRIWAMDWKATGFIAYELVGCLGLGPSLEDIRSAAQTGHLAALGLSLLLPLTLILSAGILGTLYLFRKDPSSKHEARHFRACVFTLAVVAILMVGMSIAIHKPLWARHFSPVLPFLVCIEGYWISRAWASGVIVIRGLVCLFLGLLLASSIMVRVSPAFAKDDYRGAAAMARETLAKGGEVWWSAAEYTGMFYQLPLDLTANDAVRAVRVPRQSTEESLKRLPRPTLILITRPEVYDSKGVVSKFVTENGYVPLKSLQNFQIFSSPASSR